MKSGRAPNLARARAPGLRATRRCSTTAPNVLTLSEVGWSSIASGVWPDKHRRGRLEAQHGPGAGHQERLSRLHHPHRDRGPRVRHLPGQRLGRTSARPRTAGPIFGSAMDARFNVAIAEERLELWDAGDVEGSPRPPPATCAAPAPRRQLRVPRPRGRDGPPGGLRHAGLRRRDSDHRPQDRPGAPGGAIAAELSLESWTILVTTSTDSARSTSRRS